MNTGWINEGNRKDGKMNGRMDGQMDGWEKEGEGGSVREEKREKG